MRAAVLASCLLAFCLFGAASAQSFPSFTAAMKQGQYSRLSTVVDTLGLAKTFSNPQLKLTVFVPTNEAFSNAEKRTGISIATLSAQKSLMQQVVYYHIVKEVVRAPLPARQLPTFVSGKFLTGAGMTVKGVGSNEAKIVQANIKCGAGMAHGISNVLTFLNIGALGR
ncbi:MAG: FAS1 domain-containing protein [Monoraphidium minutum]|nr:MAG: FAS1 domain-containing protein [Monoraphidium minutum]